MQIMTHAKFYFNRPMLTLIFAIWASEPPRAWRTTEKAGPDRVNLNPVWEFYQNVAFVNFITLIALRWFGQFITSRQLFLAIKLIAFLYISNSKCTGGQLWNSQTGSKLKKKRYGRASFVKVQIFFF